MKINNYINKNQDLIDCVCCGGNEWNRPVKLPKFIFGDNYKIFRCNNCGCGITYPLPSGDESYYQNNIDYKLLFSENGDDYLRFANELFSFIEKNISINSKNLLDVGCGAGYLVKVANERGVKAYGIDENILLFEGDGEYLNMLSNKSIDALFLENKKFDILVFSSVLEHMLTPDIFIQKCKNILADNGVMIVSQASMDGLLPKLFYMGWYGWQPKEHFWHFTKNSMDQFFQNNGFEIFAYHRKNLFHKWYFRGGVKTIIGRNFAKLVALVAGIVNMGDSINYVVKLRNDDGSSR